MKKRNLIILMLILSLTLVACGNDGGSDDNGATVDESEMGELVPSIDILTSLPEDNMVNYEMSNEIVAELQKLGVDIKATPTDFAVLNAWQ